MSQSPVVDVLIVTALPEELDALLEVRAGLHEVWTPVGGDPPYHHAIFETTRGPLRVAAARQTKAGMDSAAKVLERLVEKLKPRCIAMCGVCAGHPEDTDYGDVVIADRVFGYQKGKVKSSGFQSDVDSYRLREQWVYEAQELTRRSPTDLHGYAPATEDDAQWWFLAQLWSGYDPLKSVAIRRYLPDELRAARLERWSTQLQCIGLKKDGTYGLHRKGRAAITKHLAVHGTLATRLPYEIHVGPMASGEAVVADGKTWSILAASGMRKTLAIEMEAAAVGQVAHDHRLPFVVVKGVMDHADANKTDRFKRFAARASADVLLHFLRIVLEPHSNDHVEAPPAVSTVESHGPRADEHGGGNSHAQSSQSDGQQRRTDAWRQAVVDELVAALRNRPKLISHLAEGHPPWRSAAVLGAEAIAAAMLAVPQTTLTGACLAAMRRLDVDPTRGDGDASALMLVFTYALPYVASLTRSLWLTDEGRWVTNVRQSQTLEPHAAWQATAPFALPKLELYPPQTAGGFPTPRFYVPVRTDHVPEPGITIKERVSVVANDLRARYKSPQDIGRDWHAREGGLDVFQDIPASEQPAAFNAAVSETSRQHVYTMVREPSPVEQRFLAELYAALPSLRIVESRPTAENLLDDYKLLAQLRELYLCYQRCAA